MLAWHRRGALTRQEGLGAGGGEVATNTVPPGAQQDMQNNRKHMSKNVALRASRVAPNMLALGLLGIRGAVKVPMPMARLRTEMPARME